MSEATGISLVDNTVPDQPPTAEGEQRSGPTLSLPKSLVRKVSKRSLREGHARRKYAKWQQARYGDMLDDRAGSRSREGSLSRLQSAGADRQPSTPSRSISRGPSRASHITAARTDGEPTTEGEATAEHPCAEALGQQTEVDVLYENQRGWFFFGLPLFSDQSLLNLDPPAWMTPNNEKSPVDVTNAQVPDPSWEWSWKTWYVDMSYDVDEEGWQYSFSFASKFSWHGTHPWFHSFVRRRRWLRQRVKKPHWKRKEEHAMGSSWADEYFTVCTHTRTPSVRSRDRTIGDGGGRSTYTSSSKITGADQEERVPPDEITNTVALSKAIKLANLDREKIDAVREFVGRGGEELVYLKDKVWLSFSSSLINNHLY